MSAHRIQSGLPASSQIHVDETRARTAPEKKSSGFGAVLRAGANVVLSGVEVGAHVVGGPILGAAVREVRHEVAGAPTGPLGAAAGGANAPTDEQSTLEQVRAMQEQAQEFNLQYLAIQNEVQQDNRQFSTVSNVLKAKHDTSKSAINNIRS